MAIDVINSYMPPYPATQNSHGAAMLHVLTQDSAGLYAMYSAIVHSTMDRIKAEAWVVGSGQKATRALALATFSFDKEMYRD